MYALVEITQTHLKIVKIHVKPEKVVKTKQK